MQRKLILVFGVGLTGMTLYAGSLMFRSRDQAEQYDSNKDTVIGYAQGRFKIQDCGNRDYGLFDMKTNEPILANVRNWRAYGTYVYFRADDGYLILDCSKSEHKRFGELDRVPDEHRRSCEKLRYDKGTLKDLLE